MEGSSRHELALALVDDRPGPLVISPGAAGPVARNAATGRPARPSVRDQGRRLLIEAVGLLALMGVYFLGRGLADGHVPTAFSHARALWA